MFGDDGREPVGVQGPRQRERDPMESPERVDGVRWADGHAAGPVPPRHWLSGMNASQRQGQHVAAYTDAEDG